MSEWHAQEPVHVTRLIEVCQELNILAPVLDGASPGLAVDLACLAARREYLHLDKWLGERLARDVATGGGSFMAGAIAFLEAWLTTQVDAGQPMGRLGLVPEALAAFLRGMAAVGAGREPGLAVGLGRLYQLGTRAFPGYEGLLAEAASAGGSGMPQAAFPQDVEDEANSYFQKIYSDSMPVEDVVGMLKAFKNSSNVRQQEVFACMVHNLFDEYRFFPNYPDKELDITAALFGALLHHQLVTSITLGMALRFVLQALSSPPGTKMFRFGMGAVSQFRNDLHLWPQFCGRAAAIPHLRAADEGLVAFMEKVARADASSNNGSNGGGTPGPSAAVAAAGALPSATDADLAGLSKHREASGSGVDISGISGMFTNQQLPPANSSFSGLTNGPGIGAAAAAARGSDAGGVNAGGNAAAPHGKQEGSGQQTQQQTPREQKGGAKQGGVPNGTAAGAGGKSKTESIDKKQSMGQSLDGGEGLKELVGGGSVSAAAADLVLREKPERMTLNMTANNETLEMAERKRTESVKAPGDSITDKVSFIMNNLSQNNLSSKAKELAVLVLPQFLEWFANYLVVKRAAQVGAG
jgi:CCR4-NOT transcription complex subunit 1